MSFKAWAYKIQNAVLEVFDNKNPDGKVIDYGIKNTFPNDLLRIIDDSGTATSCIDKRTSFINADGFEDEAFSKKIINVKGQTADSVLADLCPYVATFEGGCLLVKYALDGKTPSVEVIPFQYVRKKSGGGFVVNYTYGTKKWDKNKDIHYGEWDKNKTPAERKALKETEIDKGTLIYFYVNKPGQEIYPVPTYYSAIEDVESDSAVIKSEKANVTEGYNANVVLKIIGEVDDKTKDDHGKTAKKYLDETIDEFKGPGGNKFMVLNASTPENIPELEVIDMSPALDSLDKASDRIPRRVCRHFQVPPILVGLTTPEGLGNTQALHNYIILFSSAMLKFQALTIEQFDKIYGTEENHNIGTLNLISYVDPAILEKLTTDEIRALAGYPANETSEPSEAEKVATKLGNISPLVANKILESMTEDEIRALVGLGIKPKTGTNVS